MESKRACTVNAACVLGSLTSTVLSGHKTMTAVFAFSRLIRKRSPEQNIGLLLPTSSAGVITNMACLLLGRTVVNLNYTASLVALSAAAEKAELRSIYTSRRFIKKLAQRGVELDSLLSRVYLAEALLKFRDGGDGEALMLLRETVNSDPRAHRLVEDIRAIEDARVLLGQNLR